MKTISFTIPGDPVPYLRMTQGQLKLLRIPDHRLSIISLALKNRIQKYFAYRTVMQSYAVQNTYNSKPKNKIFLNLKIYFRNGAHGDPDNVFKSISDGLFQNDRNVAGSFDFWIDPKNPRVEAEIKEN